ncbi:MAG: hypothetical protein J3K34DRAFT_430646 [Monoraphidium minutum]|nr:MAG: hypothetical protein J3K34DRAFT_430646 [Monoraphidium minutum]
MCNARNPHTIQLYNGPPRYLGARAPPCGARPSGSVPPRVPPTRPAGPLARGGGGACGLAARGGATPYPRAPPQRPLPSPRRKPPQCFARFVNLLQAPGAPRVWDSLVWALRPALSWAPPLRGPRACRYPLPAQHRAPRRLARGKKKQKKTKRRYTLGF